jgi:hypothetical protein
MSLQDPDNLVYLPNHTGPHPPDYHEWVYINLLDALQGKQTMEEKQRALKERLEKIKQWLLENHDKLNLTQGYFAKKTFRLPKAGEKNGTEKEGMGKVLGGSRLGVIQETGGRSHPPCCLEVSSGAP